MKTLFAALMGLALMFSTPTFAQQTCFEEVENVMYQLMRPDGYGEQIVDDAVFVSNNGSRILVIYLANAETGTWTLVAMDVNMTSVCLLEWGTDYDPAGPSRIPYPEA